MCGISGFISSQPQAAQTIQRMTSLVRHRGPDDEGYLLVKQPGAQAMACSGSDTSPDVFRHLTPFVPSRSINAVADLPVTLALGHRRLSIVDLSPLGHQPMCTPDGRYWIVYNGEIYNHVELRQILQGLGHVFLSNSDTEVILASYAEWGPESLQRFNGMWAFAIYDTGKQEIFLARDRLGVKPLYIWAAPAGSFCFASEIKQFTAFPGWQAKLNAQRAYDFLNYGLTDHTSETLFDGVMQLRGGEYLQCSLEALENPYAKVRRWYEIRPARVESSFCKAAAQFRCLFTDAVSLRLHADVPVGTGLSGGLDSSSIVCMVSALLANHPSKDQQTFSACAQDSRFDERYYIDKVIEHSQAHPNYIYPQLHDFLNNLRKIIWHHDEPLGGASIFAEWKVFEFVSGTSVKVTLDGHGADELLAGYHSFFRSHFASLLSHGHWRALRHEVKATHERHGYSLKFLLESIGDIFLPNRLRKTLRWIHGSNVSRAAWLETQKLGIDEYYLDERFIEKASNIRAHSVAQLLTTSLPLQLRWCDRDSMAHGIESRAPFLDYRLVEFTLGCPDSFKIRDGVTKQILRHAMADTLPPEIANRQDKMGFVTPELAWICEDNPALFMSLAAKAVKRTEGIVNHLAAERVRAIVEGREPFNLFVWRLISFAEWFDIFDLQVCY